MTIQKPYLRARTWTIFPDGALGIAWMDDHESWYPGRELRLACSCAHCIDEMTGEKMLQDHSIAADVRPVEIKPVGNYGVGIRFSDDHDTGIYTFNKLRAVCPCEACRK